MECHIINTLLVPNHTYLSWVKSSYAIKALFHCLEKVGGNRNLDGEEHTSLQC